MLYSALEHTFIATLLLSWALAGSAIMPLEDFFDVQLNSGPWSCDDHLDLLKGMFNDIQKVNDNAAEQLQTVNYNSNVETRKLAKSIFGVSPSGAGTAPAPGMDLDRLTKVQKWYTELKDDIDKQDPSQLTSKVQLYCDSNFMDLKELTDPAPGDSSKTVKDVLKRKGLLAEAHVSWIYHIPTQDILLGGVWLLLPKKTWSSFPIDDTTGKPSYCAQKDTYAWTLEDDSDQRSQPIIILCPASFTKQNVYGGDIPDKLDLSKQEVGKVLDTMEPRWLTWYHELFHVTQEPNTAGIDQAPDAQYRPARKGKNGNIFSSWPGKKSGFAAKARQTYGAVECMYTALYDLAEPEAGNIQDMQAVKNPESYAWFGLASYLSVFGAEHQDWSSGACRDEGSPAETVTVTRGGNVPRQTTA